MKTLKYILTLLLALNSVLIFAQDYKTHQVKHNETVQEIASKYNVSAQEIYKFNPDVKNNLTIGSTLIIPIATGQSNLPEYETVKELTEYKSHKVRRNDNLYRLSQKYKVTQEEIKEHNPTLMETGLKKGDRIQIPVFKTKQILKVTKAPIKTYTVQPSEGKWRIAYKFGITTQELEKLNPTMGESLQVGQVINVPNLETTEVKHIDEQYSYYKVLPAEGYYRLKVKLNLTQSELEALNPELVQLGLKEGMVLKIPYTSMSTASTGVSGNNESTPIALANSIRDFSQKRIAIMLPFKLNRVDANATTEAKAFIQKDAYADFALDFHSGALMALDSLKKLGLNIKVDVYDTKREASAISQLITSDKFRDLDAVIGPIDSKVFNQASMLLQSYNVPIVSPIAKSITLKDNVFQSRPDEKFLIKKVVDYVKNDPKVKNVVIVSDSKNRTVSTTIKQTLTNAKQVFSRTNKKTGKDAYYVLDTDLINALKPGKNVVFLETENQGFASNVSSILNAVKTKEKDIVLATTNLNDAFEGEEVSNMHLSNLKFLYPTIAKTYSESNKNSFISNYKTKYGMSPNKVAVRGFDITMDVILRLSTSRSLFDSASEVPQTSYLENIFAYKKKSFGGYTNEAVYLVNIDNLEVKEVKD